MEQENARPRQGDTFLIEQQKQLEQDWSDKDLQGHNAKILAINGSGTEEPVLEIDFFNRLYLFM